MNSALNDKSNHTHTHITRHRQVAAQLANLQESTRLEFGAVP